MEVAKDVKQPDAEAAALQIAPVAKFLDDKDVKKVIFVPGRILNFIVSNK